MSKYTPLEDHLRQQNASLVSLSFAEIERLIQDDLPPPARKHRAWWSNKPANSAMANAWFSAGYKSAAIDLAGETVVFIKFTSPRPRKQGDVLPGGAITPKYAALEDHLRKKNASRVSLSFAEIERLIRDDLPPPARKHLAWWRNKPSNSAIADAWFSAGYKSAAVDLAGETVVFVKFASPRPKEKRELYGCLSEYVTLVDGYDLTQPTSQEWERLDD